MRQLYKYLKNHRQHIFVVLLCVFAQYQLSYGQSNKEALITIDNGLVNNEVTAIHQDKFGFLWFGTRGGLNKYDGYDFNLLRYNPKSGNNLTSQAVEAIAEDNKYTLWIGTKNGGLNSYNLLKDSITNYFPANNIKIQEIKSLLVDNDGTVFIASTHGLYTFKNGKFKIINDKLAINCIKIDGKRRVWVGASTGFFVLEPRTSTLQLIELGPEIASVNSLVLDEKNDAIYVGTWNNGLFKYQISQKKIEQFLHNSNNPQSISKNDVYRLYLDRSKNLWVGTWGGGLNKFNIYTKKFERIDIKPFNVFNTDYDIILSIEQDITGIIWIGTDGGGICKIDPFKKEFKTITEANSQLNGLTNTHVKSVFQDCRGGLWIGTKGGGLYYSKDKITFVRKNITEKANVVFTFFENNGKDLWVGTANGMLIYNNYIENNDNPIHVINIKKDYGLSGPKISAIVKDQDQNIWVGTQEHGLNKLIGGNGDDLHFKKYAERTTIKDSLQNSRISCMLVDSKNRLWIGTYNGLHLYNKGKDDFYVFKRNSFKGNTLSNNTILSLAEDNRGNIWIGTQQGLNKMVFKNQNNFKITSFFQQIGLPNDYIHSILVDSFDNIWVATNSGISKFNIKINSFINFDERDGVSSNTFSENSSFEAKDGQMFFGGIRGLTYFYPNDIRLNRYQPKVFITNIKIDNAPVNVGEVIGNNTILTKALFLTHKIELTHKESILSLSFSALDFHASNKNQYIYKLQGFEKNWVKAGKRRSVTYTNLPAGSYTFRVRASNSDQIWNPQEAALSIDVLPPPWKTWWAYTIYGLIILALLGFSRSITLARLRLKNKLEIADLNVKKEHEITEMKSKFFANISHEFRTPLTLMIGPLETISNQNNIEHPIKQTIEKVKNQSKRLLSLVNQLLDFNKAETNALTLNAFDQDVSALLYSVYESFVDEAERKSINYSYESSQLGIYLNVDKDKLESICYNLLSNAFKFTPKGGEICFRVNAVIEQKICEISVSDSGNGIIEADKDKVFNRFYQVSQAEPGQYAGTGIGLAFVKDLVILHNGSIVIENNSPKGTIFKVCLVLSSLSEALVAEVEEDEIGIAEEIVLDDDAVEDNDLPILLVVEDNEELNHYISETLAGIGKVISAKNGKEGVEKAFQTIPDLVVSDVMMPEMDGYTLCKTLKTDNHTSHIPIILLTAKSDDVSHIQGIELGADNYLAKPFNPEVLISHVKSLIKSRKKLKELFANRLNLAPNQVEVSSFDEELIKKSIEYIEANMQREKPSIDDLASQLNMSRSTFYRKLKALTGMSGSDFISLIRLKRSAQLLETGEYSVSMAAYEVGYNDLKNFRKSFHSQFGMNPSDYLKAKQK
jgi:ligand-binding sensor domain-containing protein/signal transduction histidine kinase/DNA-binding response OmpR family regulator